MIFIFFPLRFLRSQLLRAETRDPGGALMSAPNALTAMKSVSQRVSEEYQRKPSCLDSILERSGRGLPRTGTPSSGRRRSAANFGQTERRLKLPGWQTLAWGADSEE